MGRRAAILIKAPHASNYPQVDLHDQTTHTLIHSGRWCEQRVQCTCTSGTHKTIIIASLYGHPGASSDTQTARRNENLHDRPVLLAAHKAYRESGGSMKALILSLMTSDAFLYRTVDDGN